MIRFGGLLWLILIVVAVVDVWQHEQNLEKRLLWTVVIILIPFIGMLAWFLISRKIIRL